MLIEPITEEILVQVKLQNCEIQYLTLCQTERGG
jgi:hypothetical protein